MGAKLTCWTDITEADALPCPSCKGRDLSFNANVVICMDCEFEGPRQPHPEFACDWRLAINDWNVAAGGHDYFRLALQESPDAQS